MPGSRVAPKAGPRVVLRAVQKDMRITNIRLLEKSGGKSGDYRIKE